MSKPSLAEQFRALWCLGPKKDLDVVALYKWIEEHYSTVNAELVQWELDHKGKP